VRSSLKRCSSYKGRSKLSETVVACVAHPYVTTLPGLESGAHVESNS
jgi:hypothetical protein